MQSAQDIVFQIRKTEHLKRLISRARINKMTMRYTHIGINDQAKTLQQLPWSGPKAAGFSEPTKPSSENGAQHPGSEPGGCGCHNGAVAYHTSEPGRIRSPAATSARVSGQGRAPYRFGIQVRGSFQEATTALRDHRIALSYRNHGQSLKSNSMNCNYRFERV